MQDCRAAAVLHFVPNEFSLFGTIFVPNKLNLSGTIARLQTELGGADAVVL